MKFIHLTQIRPSGEEPEIITLGRVAVDIESISGFFEIWDKHDMPIKGVLAIKDNHGGQFLVKKDYDELVKELEELSYA